MKVPLRRILLRTLAGLGLLLTLLAAVAGAIWLYLHPSAQYSREAYGRRHDEALNLDILQPAKGNGAGVVLMHSGSWKSDKGATPVWLVAPLLRRGYTVFALHHVSQPKATVMEIVEDVHAGLAHVRKRAPEFGVDPDRLGVTGGSSGGHLSLMLATGAGISMTNATARPEKIGVKAAAIFFPVTDLLNLGSSTENLGDGGPPKSYVKAFGPDSTNLVVWRPRGQAMSPIYHVTSNLPPILIAHGDADTLVPLDQSERFLAKARELDRDVTLVVYKGKGHGWLTMSWDIRRFAIWFDRHLLRDRN
jgi:acetyl esterase/lipase